jgi:hypothetical protein
MRKACVKLITHLPRVLRHINQPQLAGRHRALTSHPLTPPAQPPLRVPRIVVARHHETLRAAGVSVFVLLY